MTDQERITVNLTRQGLAALSELTGLTGYGKTDTVNRALVAYARMERARANNGEIVVREGGEDRVIEFL